jgi:hypothetical protein
MRAVPAEVEHHWIFAREVEMLVYQLLLVDEHTHALTYHGGISVLRT